MPNAAAALAAQQLHLAGPNANAAAVAAAAPAMPNAAPAPGGNAGFGKGGPSKYEGEGDPSDNLYIMGLPKEFDTDSVQQFFGAVGNVIQAKSFGNGYALVRFGSMAEAKLCKESLHGQKPIGCVQPLTITYALEKKNDWYCPKCGDLQFQKNSVCRLCGAPKDGTEQPADAAAHYAAMKGGCKGKAKLGASPYGGGDKGKGKQTGPCCTVAEFIDELVAGGIPGGDQDLNSNCVVVSGLPPDTAPENLYQIFATFGPIIPRGARIDGTNGQCSGTGYVSFMETAGADMAVMALHGIALRDGQKLQVQKQLDSLEAKAVAPVP